MQSIAIRLRTRISSPLVAAVAQQVTGVQVGLKPPSLAKTFRRLEGLRGAARKLAVLIRLDTTTNTQGGYSA
jgi:hypothetical protein